jgi:hypothetical protein
MQNALKPVPTDSQIAIAWLPVSIYPTAFACCDQRLPLHTQQQGGNRHHQAEMQIVKGMGFGQAHPLQ